MRLVPLADKTRLFLKLQIVGRVSRAGDDPLFRTFVSGNVVVLRARIFIMVLDRYEDNKQLQNTRHGNGRRLQEDEDRFSLQIAARGV